MGSHLPEVESLDATAAAFSVLGRFHLDSPDQGSLEALWELLDGWPLPATTHARKGLEQLRLSRKNRESSTAIRRDHDRLYGATASAEVPPYESVHLGREGLIFDTQTLEVRAAYRELSLVAPRLNREPDDHIGLEFDFLAHTCLRAIDALDAENPAAAAQAVVVGRRFLIQHVQAWAPQMLTQVVERAHTHFMSGVALLSLGTLESYAELVAA